MDVWSGLMSTDRLSLRTSPAQVPLQILGSSKAVEYSRISIWQMLGGMWYQGPLVI